MPSRGRRKCLSLKLCPRHGAASCTYFSFGVLRKTNSATKCSWLPVKNCLAVHVRFRGVPQARFPPQQPLKCRERGDIRYLSSGSAFKDWTRISKVFWFASKALHPMEWAAQPVCWGRSLTCNDASRWMMFENWKLPKFFDCLINRCGKMIPKHKTLAPRPPPHSHP